MFIQQINLYLAGTQFNLSIAKIYTNLLNKLNVLPETLENGGGVGGEGGGVGANLAKCGILYYTSIIILDHSL